VLTAAATMLLGAKTKDPVVATGYPPTYGPATPSPMATRQCAHRPRVITGGSVFFLLVFWGQKKFFAWY